MIHVSHEFTLLLDGVDEMTFEIADKLFEAGATDCTPGRSMGQCMILFNREASTRAEAIQTAIRDVLKADIGVTGVRVEEE